MASHCHRKEAKADSAASSHPARVGALMWRRVPEPLAFDHSVTQASSASLRLGTSRTEMRSCTLTCIGLRQLRSPVSRMTSESCKPSQPA